MTIMSLVILVLLPMMSQMMGNLLEKRNETEAWRYCQDQAIEGGALEQTRFTNKQTFYSQQSKEGRAISVEFYNGLEREVIGVELLEAQ